MVWRGASIRENTVVATCSFTVVLCLSSTVTQYLKALALQSFHGFHGFVFMICFLASYL